MVEKLFEYGAGNYTKVKEDVKEESMFRFDHFLRTRNESDIKKRATSLFRLIEKEK